VCVWFKKKATTTATHGARQCRAHSKCYDAIIVLLRAVAIFAHVHLSQTTLHCDCISRSYVVMLKLMVFPQFDELDAFPIYVEPDATVAAIRLQCCAVTRSQPDRMRIMCREQLLELDRSIGWYGVVNMQAMFIYSIIDIEVVTMTGGTLRFEVEATNQVSVVKQHIADRTGASVYKQRLVFGTQTLCNMRSMSDYGIDHGATLHLVMVWAAPAQPPQPTQPSWWFKIPPQSKQPPRRTELAMAQLRRAEMMEQLRGDVAEAAAE
jgi:ubiquitin-like protein Nedd8